MNLTYYTPVWSAESRDPSIGNGSLLAHYYRTGPFVTFCIRLQIGTTTDVGSGPWRFSLPVQGLSLLGCTGAGVVLDTGTNWRTFTARLHSAQEIGLYTDGIAQLGVGSGVPVTWANGDYVVVSGDYLADIRRAVR